MRKHLFTFGLSILWSISAAAEPATFWEEAFPTLSPDSQSDQQQFAVGLGETFFLGMAAAVRPSYLRELHRTQETRVRSLANEANAQLAAHKRELEAQLSELRDAKAKLMQERRAFYRANSSEFGPSLNTALAPGEYEVTIQRFNRELARLEALEPELALQVGRANAMSTQDYENAVARINRRENLSRNEAREFRRLRYSRISHYLRGVLYGYIALDGVGRMTAAWNGRSPGLTPAIDLSSTMIKRALFGPASAPTADESSADALAPAN